MRTGFAPLSMIFEPIGALVETFITPLLPTIVDFCIEFGPLAKDLGSFLAGPMLAVVKGFSMAIFGIGLVIAKVGDALTGGMFGLTASWEKTWAPTTESPPSSGTRGTFQTGTSYVPRTGNYFLHRGEKVSRSNEVDILINVSGNVYNPEILDDLTQEIELYRKLRLI